VIFDRRINLLGNRFARKSARDAADNRAGNCSDWPSRHACCCSCCRTTNCCTNARADRMSTRFIRNRIAIFVTIDIFTPCSHDRTSKGKTCLHRCVARLQNAYPNI
jgi:hypothetical protein